ncbi:MAG: shikimate dehydrogenase [Pseudonocardia sp.]|nr:shikimate dehydrogenase [Pseudonocardia sp.]
MRAAVLGSPIAHSLSPVLHTAAYAALDLDGWTYTAHDCTEDGLAPFVEALDAGWAGLSLTMPLKRVALDVAAEVSPLAAAVGAANTLVLGGRRYADNTDVAGLFGALGPVAGRAVVLGAGGTAQAALAALRNLGIDTVDVLVRDLGRTGELRATAERLGVAPDVHAALADPGAFVDGADVVISTLPAGAADHVACRGAGTVLDAVYAPWPTRFAEQAAGARVVSGMDMLLHQAVAQVELMTGRHGPLEAMRTALVAAVGARSS